MAKKKPYTLEFIFRASPNMLFNFLTTPTGLSQWFAEKVDTIDDTYIFDWSGSEERATVIELVEPEFARFKWEDSDEGEYFEFRIEKSDVTTDTVLFVTDFAADYELEDQKMLWESQIHDLAQRIGG
jgi:uncharacterized protein YndB with AHSA1/START domain